MNSEQKIDSVLITLENRHVLEDSLPNITNTSYTIVSYYKKALVGLLNLLEQTNLLENKYIER